MVSVVHGAYASASVGKRTDSTGLGSLATGAVTALALAVQTGLAAVVGVIIAREFGRGAETDGFFAAYGVFIVIVLIGERDPGDDAALVRPRARRAAARRRSGLDRGSSWELRRTPRGRLRSPPPTPSPTC